MHKSLFFVVKYQVCALKMPPKVLNIQPITLTHSTKYSQKGTSKIIQYQRNVYILHIQLS